MVSSPAARRVPVFRVAAMPQKISFIINSSLTRSMVAARIFGIPLGARYVFLAIRAFFRIIFHRMWSSEWFFCSGVPKERSIFPHPSIPLHAGPQRPLLVESD